MAELTTDQARQLIGGPARFNGQGLLAGRVSPGSR